MNVDMLFLLAEIGLVAFIFVRLVLKHIGKVMPDVSKYTGKLSGLVKRVNIQEKKKKASSWYEGYHILLYGSTGKGKSTYLNSLLSDMSKDDTTRFIVVNPHFHKGQYGIEHCVGAKRNFKEIEESVESILDIVNQRFEEYYNTGNVSEGSLYFVIEELPAIIANTKKGVISSVLKQVSSEARKVKVFLIIVSQSKLVTQLGMERASDLLQNFVLVKVAKPNYTYTLLDLDGNQVEHTERFSVKDVDLKGRMYQDEN